MKTETFKMRKIMLTKRIMLTALLAIVVLLTAASSVLTQQSSEMLREEFHQTYPLAADGRVSLENINGAVHVTAWDRNEVKVDAVKTAYRRERLDEAKIEVQSEPNSINIRTEYPHQSQTFDNGEGRYNNPATVEYTLTVPRDARIDSIELINGNLDLDGLRGDVKASTINGRLTARGLTGATKLSTINGKLEASFDHLDESKPISIGSVNGSVLLTIPSDANAELKAGTVHGAITNDFGLPVRNGEYVGHDLAGQLGQGGTRIKIGNVNGSITIRHAADGRPLSHATSLYTQTDKVKEKEKDKDFDIDGVNAEVRRAAREAALEASRNIRETQRMQADQMRAAVEAQKATQREARQQRMEALRTARESKVEMANANALRLVQRESKTFSVTGAPHVTAQTFDGYITVQGWDKPEVQLTINKRAATEQQMSALRLRAEQNGSEINIVAEFDKNIMRETGGNTNALVNLDLYVPRNANVRLSSGDGHLELEGVNGDLNLNTGDGRISVRDAQGRLSAHTGDGRIEVENFEGSVEAKTGDGRISLGGRFAQLSAQTGDGSIMLTLPANSNATIETDSESVDTEGLNAMEEARTSKRLRRWKIGQGGNVLSLRAGEGRIILRSAGQ
jgi:DUF4097 and DUF4098 domain-containing protein YvlB